MQGSYWKIDIKALLVEPGLVFACQNQMPILIESLARFGTKLSRRVDDHGCAGRGGGHPARRCIVLIALLITGWGAPLLTAQVDTAKLATIGEAWRESQHVDITSAMAQQALAYASTLQGDGSWKDISFEESAATHNFPAQVHLQRLSKLSLVGRWATDADTRSRCITAYVAGARFWATKRPQSANGWYNKVYSPNTLGLSALVVADVIDQATIDEIVSYVKSAADWPALNYAGGTATGQNLLWMAEGQMIAAVLGKDATYYQWAEDNFLQAFAVTSADGIQSDFSFHQHGPQLYAGGYGSEMMNEGSLILGLIAPVSSRALSAAETLSGYLLEGERWFIYKDGWDFNAVGRYINRGSLKDATTIAAARRLSALALTRRSELASFVSAYDENAGYPDLVGTKYYWRSDTAVFRGTGWYASVRSTSTRTFGNESGNGEGLLSYHLGNGSTCLMKTGAEYARIFPLWNWTLVPGVTCPHQAVENLPLIPWGVGSAGGSAYVGGLATGNTGVAAMQLSRAGVTAKKSWFFIDDCLVCLGAGITADSSYGPITTSVDQCWASGQTAINNRELSKNRSGAVTGSSPATVINGGFLYRFPSGGSIRAERATSTAHWKRINLAAAAEAASSGEVFRLWLDHGTGPSGATYAYIVEPIDQAPTDFPGIFSNTEAVQSVVNRERTTVQAVFWAAGRIDVPGFLRLETDTPAIIQATRTARGVTFTVANPLQDFRAVRIKVTLLDASSKATSATKTVALTFAFGEGSSTTTTVTVP